MIQSEFLFIEASSLILLDLYRFGNAMHSRLDNARPLKDIAVQVINGIEVVIANGNGVSLSSTFDPSKRNTWKLAKSTPLPVGLSLVSDLRPGRQDHFLLAPSMNMPLVKYIGLLQELALRCVKIN